MVQIPLCFVRDRFLTGLVLMSPFMGQFVKNYIRFVTWDLSMGQFHNKFNVVGPIGSFYGTVP
ncbi:hypothetical protein AM1BK_51000 [Neobacillus kokaensis]|uniref:Uncharacterized protein n=1 Tax=Neobacillus kokaensis TaxID=2759023 RepID=A0ABQ3NCD5_9BACI|nr:hypothetical protein AM1BK_51000 [Neobacillus kokaensis]